MRPAFISSGAPSGCLKALMIGCLMTSACLAARSPVWLMILSSTIRVPQRYCNWAVGPCRNKGKVTRLCQDGSATACLSCANRVGPAQGLRDDDLCPSREVPDLFRLFADALSAPGRGGQLLTPFPGRDLHTTVTASRAPARSGSSCVIPLKIGSGPEQGSLPITTIIYPPFATSRP